MLLKGFSLSWLQDLLIPSQGKEHQQTEANQRFLVKSFETFQMEREMMLLVTACFSFLQAPYGPGVETFGLPPFVPVACFTRKFHCLL